MHLFYQANISGDTIRLDEDEFRHCIKVLRHQTGDIIHVTNGKGKIVTARITNVLKNHLEAAQVSEEIVPPPTFQSHLFIAPTKQMERMEWMVEKCCELGLSAITFIQTKNSERTKLKTDRLLKKSVSALKQSKGAWMTHIQEMVTFPQACQQAKGDRKLIAALFGDPQHVMQLIPPNQAIDLFIGPEGDFTEQEMLLAQQHGLEAVSLGHKVLRTETAGFFACSAVHLINQS